MMQRSNLITTVIAAAVAGLCFSCRHTPVSPKTICNNPAIVSFNHDIKPIFNVNCNISGCHSGPFPAGNLNLEDSVAYASLMKPGSGYIDTLNPKFSLLYTQMNSVSQPMPPTGNLDVCTRDLVLEWITQKAKNN